MGHLASVVEAAQVTGWDAGRILAAATTLDSAREKRGAERTRALIAARTAQDEPVVAECLVEHGASDPAAEILVELHGESGTTTNLAEREAIAWCLARDSSGVFVTYDKRAALTALAELGRGRVAHGFDVWLDLLDLGWIRRGQFDTLCKLSRKNDPGLERMPGRVTARMSSPA